MAVTSTPALPQAVNTGVVQAVNADGTAAKTVFTAGANGSKVTGLVANSSDTAARIFQVQLTRGGTNYVLTTVTIPANSGTDGVTASVDLLNSALLPGLSVDNDGQRYLLLKSGDTLTVQLNTGAVTAAKAVSFVATGADF